LLSWIAPRGIVAAAVASLFALELEKHGFEGGPLRAMVFTLIGVTVLISGLTGGIAAQLLGLKRPRNVGWVILSANYLSKTLAKILIKSGEEVLCIDQNPKACRRAEEDGIKIIYGNGLDEKILLRAEIDTRIGVIGLSSNEEVNLLYGTKAKEVGKTEVILVGIKTESEGITFEMVKEIGASIPFGGHFDIEQWSGRIQRGTTSLEEFAISNPVKINRLIADAEGIILPLVLHRKSKARPIDDSIELKKGDIISVLLNTKKEIEVKKWVGINELTLVNND